ncbi:MULTISPECIES: PTS sugar transporter subunit IIA [unclassified Clostridioides]|uniref:BglG family transcription antiterminator n=1 Tax=unclassified Clostridioides TaxID=2635829 RepID=UPI001D12383F|nr:PTS sugar transporter subunit IIA [Clostridioides sp. ZZV14-6150]MCC0668210.1 PTS sugar transporter subunit IIA [Clostridioides sp. ZZV14-6153]MCC0722505.1 PTS sugar transporter subunit IIA [Clostridioides sp. ZZV14-6104]MCC0743356.1 PTS sugar transporter subunit IIA [Clostridioides sp. ZZV14-6044]MCC0751539.1 PTS sugar transporter subunit IIA [Clostridioides sp. ZZV13-5731]
MISGRMLLIMNFLKEKEKTSYREISQQLSIEERKIRYDINNLNIVLQSLKKPLIQKINKGVLIIPKDFQVVYIDNNDYVFSLTERVSIMKIISMFKIDKLNLEKLSKEFQVSRSSIKNDLNVLSNELERNKITITYDKTFKISGDENTIYKQRLSILKSYSYLFGKEKSDLSVFEQYLVKIIEQIFKGICLNDIYNWSTDLLSQMDWTLNDESFTWYVSNIFLFTWYIHSDEKHPLESSSLSEPYFENKFDQEFEQIIQKKLTKEQILLLKSFVFFTNKYASLNEDMDLISTEIIVQDLIYNMSEILSVDFKEDMILYKGLLNHIAPLIERIKQNIQIYEELFHVIPDKYQYVLEATKVSIQKNRMLNQIRNENEIILLAIHFLGSVQRNERNNYKNILLVCGFGYGVIAMLKDTLINDYQINILDSIPAYKLQDYKDWENIDFIITTSKIATTLPKVVIEINPFLQENDYLKLEEKGIKRKNVLTNYISIKKRLDFLEEDAQKRVLSIIWQELGYSDERILSRQLKLSDLIGADTINIIDKEVKWEDAVKISSNILADCDFVSTQYAENIIDILKNVGFYAVKDEEFALLHGNDSSLVKVSSISLLICKEPISFGDKKVKVIFCLASRDKKEQIPAIINLTKMVYKTNFISMLESARTKEEAEGLIHKYEEEVTV